MNNHTIEPFIFPVPLSFEAHSLALQYHQQQNSPQKAKQVYLNTLAIYAVDYYLHCLGWETERNKCDSCDKIALKFMDVADLAVKQLGKLECRPVLPDTHICPIPPEATIERIGYVIVELDRSLKQASILGFTPTATTEISLDNLRLLNEFPEYLNSIRFYNLSQTEANLSKWLEGIFEGEWLEEQAILKMRTKKNLVKVRNSSYDWQIKQAKLLDLGIRLGEKTIALAIAIKRNCENLISVLVRVLPTEANYLPPELKLALSLETGETLQQVISRSQDNYIQLKIFHGQKGDCFKIEVSLDRATVTEKFQF